MAWQPLPGTTAALTKALPLNDRNPVAMELTAGPGEPCSTAVQLYSAVQGSTGAGVGWVQGRNPVAMDLTGGPGEH